MTWRSGWLGQAASSSSKEFSHFILSYQFQYTREDNRICHKLISYTDSLLLVHMPLEILYQIPLAASYPLVAITVLIHMINSLLAKEWYSNSFGMSGVWRESVITLKYTQPFIIRASRDLRVPVSQKWPFFSNILRQSFPGSSKQASAALFSLHPSVNFATTPCN